MSKWVWNDSGRATYDFDSDTYFNMPEWFKNRTYQRAYERMLMQLSREES